MYEVDCPRCRHVFDVGEEARTGTCPACALTVDLLTEEEAGRLGYAVPAPAPAAPEPTTGPTPGPTPAPTQTTRTRRGRQASPAADAGPKAPPPPPPPEQFLEVPCPLCSGPLLIAPGDVDGLCAHCESPLEFDYPEVRAAYDPRRASSADAPPPNAPPPGPPSAARARPAVFDPGLPVTKQNAPLVTCREPAPAARKPTATEAATPAPAQNEAPNEPALLHDASTVQAAPAPVAPTYTTVDDALPVEPPQRPLAFEPMLVVTRESAPMVACTPTPAKRSEPAPAVGTTPPVAFVAAAEPLSPEPVADVSMAAPSLTPAAETESAPPVRVIAKAPGFDPVLLVTRDRAPLIECRATPTVNLQATPLPQAEAVIAHNGANPWHEETLEVHGEPTTTLGASPTIVPVESIEIEETPIDVEPLILMEHDVPTTATVMPADDAPPAAAPPHLEHEPRGEQQVPPDLTEDLADHPVPSMLEVLAADVHVALPPDVVEFDLEPAEDELHVTAAVGAAPSGQADGAPYLDPASLQAVAMIAVAMPRESQPAPMPITRDVAPLVEVRTTPPGDAPRSAAPAAAAAPTDNPAKATKPTPAKVPVGPVERVIDPEAPDGIPFARHARRVKDMEYAQIESCAVCTHPFRHSPRDREVQCPHCGAYLEVVPDAADAVAQKPKAPAARAFEVELANEVVAKPRPAPNASHEMELDLEPETLAPTPPEAPPEHGLHAARPAEPEIPLSMEEDLMVEADDAPVAPTPVPPVVPQEETPVALSAAPQGDDLHEAEGKRRFWRRKDRAPEAAAAPPIIEEEPAFELEMDEPPQEPVAEHVVATEPAHEERVSAPVVADEEPALELDLEESPEGLVANAVAAAEGAALELELDETSEEHVSEPLVAAEEPVFELDLDESPEEQSSGPIAAPEEPVFELELDDMAEAPAPGPEAADAPAAPTPLPAEVEPAHELELEPEIDVDVSVADEAAIEAEADTPVPDQDAPLVGAPLVEAFAPDDDPESFPSFEVAQVQELDAPASSERKNRFRRR